MSCSCLKISALSSIQLSPNRVSEDDTYNTVYIFPVFQVSPDAAEYLPATSPLMSLDSGSLPSSPIPPDPDCLPVVRQPTRMSSPYQTRSGSVEIITTTIPLPDDLLLLPMPVPRPPSPSPVRQSPRERLSSVVSSPMDLSQEGPFDALCVPSDTGNHPLISESLPGCSYRMTSYREEDIAEVDPSVGVQLHHLRFLECIVAEWVRTMDRQDAISAALQFQRDAGLMAWDSM